MCFDDVIVFLKVSASLHTRLAAETHLADRELLQVAKNKEKFLNYKEVLEYQQHEKETGSI